MLPEFSEAALNQERKYSLHLVCFNVLKIIHLPFSKVRRAARDARSFKVSENNPRKDKKSFIFVMESSMVSLEVFNEANLNFLSRLRVFGSAMVCYKHARFNFVEVV